MKIRQKIFLGVKIRPAEQRDLDFEINAKYIPQDFHQRDINIDEGLHLKVLKEMKRLTGKRVAQMVLDFERAVWNAIPLVFPDVTIRGYAFHWSQCVWGKIQETGLTPAYINDEGTHKFCRIYHIYHTNTFSQYSTIWNLERKASTDQLRQLTDYIRDQWIEENLWNPAAWCVFKQPIRTNNDVEGWQRALNRHARRGNITLYLLVKLLREQAYLVNMQVGHVSFHKLQ
ncbi:hypothetical protein HOLleu_08256 [Holothuria leucospilota]|uniref:Uncharacterized protein n=1 Tax=Holothuria leucospilota TaxID=206669 RepID=A0A9Q1CIN3_HOLLE|nr:hypothetical protein HOLleu_08256 [Holothuria leucospilota]